MEKLLNLLFIEDNIESQQKVTKGLNINDMQLNYGPDIIPRVPKRELFSNSFIRITKQHRYSYMPAHKHSFIEFNFIVSGQCHQVINGEKYDLKENYLLVMDRDAIHTYGYMNKNDLLVNILIDLQQVPKEFIEILNFNNELATFFYNALDENANHTNFLIFDLNASEFTSDFLKVLIYHGFKNNSISHNQERLFFSAIADLPTPKISSINSLHKANIELHNIMNFIDKNYTTVSMDILSKEFGYNKNYLSNKIKQASGSSFSDLVARKRLVVAQNLLQNSDYPIEKISEYVGFKNPSSLFRIFKYLLGTTPEKFRKNTD
ncbi:AraC family transcriptional regulator [Ligilactobacillus equi]|uniref:Transcriptional regulator, AraC family n=1 Tax=Ligilactobacillus equi DPC 6820 TaxID=1392007 RepID=V7HW48_9LACO|nr:AraC family transcriptional regulator [Ligilactobacillus equi]ETA73266.1 transcriptional regulator, AraC family [Ligilactobacillus equi DPC 6820]